MKRITSLPFLIVVLLCIPQKGFSQIKRFALNLQQPTMEECAVGIAPSKIENPFTIFPNPTEGEITISFSENMSDSRLIIQVFSLEGNILQSYIEFPEKNDFQTKLNFSTLTKGIYLIRISGDVFLANEKIILF